MSRAGKVGGKYTHCYNVENQKGEVEWIDLSQAVMKWRELPDSEDVLFCGTTGEVYKAKLEELENWSQNGVFEKVKDNGQTTVSVRWIITEKVKDGSPVVKARLVARGFEEDLTNNRTDSPTCSKDALRISSLIVAYGWECHTIDIKAAFLQGKPIERDVFIRPPKEFNDKCLWKLKKTVYGLNDAARAWYFSLKDLLLSLGMRICSLDPAFFYWIHKGVFSGVMCIHVDDILWAGTDDFCLLVESMSKKVKVGSSSVGAFKYIGVNITRIDNYIGLHQNDYVDALGEIPLSHSRATRRMDKLSKEEIEQYRALIGHFFVPFRL